MVELYDHQIEAVQKMKNGCVLVGGVGTGKSRTALAYYFVQDCKGCIPINGIGQFKLMKEPKDLYIITTAKKRDSYEWEDECVAFRISSCGDPKHNFSGVRVTIDSWNNIKKYKDIFGTFFIFDEQRVVGSGAWVKAFLNITRKNHWILLSATPGDTWSDYIPLFVANGFYKNKTDFLRQHAVFSRFAKYPKIERYVEQGRLIKHRNDILILMRYDKETVPHHVWVPVDYDKQLYQRVWKDRWDPYDNEPIRETGKLFYLLRKVVNADESRAREVSRILAEKRRVIIFYNYTYELEILRRICNAMDIRTGEWNGELHTDVPTSERWAYLVQYSAGCEGWNCITTDTIIFYSQNYSYRASKQAEGRIDRLNTPYKDLYYYHLRSSSPIDMAISRALRQKKNFNERSFLKK